VKEKNGMNYMYHWKGNHRCYDISTRYFRIKSHLHRKQYSFFTYIRCVLFKIVSNNWYIKTNHYMVRSEYTYLSLFMSIVWLFQWLV